MDMTLVSTKYQVVIPKAVRKKIGLKPGTRMRVNVAGEQIILSPAKTKKEWSWPDDYIKNLPNPWEGEDIEKYLQEEDDSWE